MSNEIVYVVNLDQQLFEMGQDIHMIEKDSFLSNNVIDNNKTILVTKINQWNSNELEELHNYFLRHNISVVNIEYDYWTDSLLSFFKFKNLTFNGELLTMFDSLYKELSNNLLNVISTLESKSTSFTNNFIVYLISILPSEISNELIKVYYDEKNSFKTTLVYLIKKVF